MGFPQQFRIKAPCLRPSPAKTKRTQTLRQSQRAASRRRTEQRIRSQPLIPAAFRHSFWATKPVITTETNWALYEAQIEVEAAVRLTDEASVDAQKKRVLEKTSKFTYRNTQISIPTNLSIDGFPLSARLRIRDYIEKRTFYGRTKLRTRSNFGQACVFTYRDDEGRGRTIKFLQNAGEGKDRVGIHATGCKNREETRRMCDELMSQMCLNVGAAPAKLTDLNTQMIVGSFRVVSKKEIHFDLVALEQEMAGRGWKAYYPQQFFAVLIETSPAQRAAGVPYLKANIQRSGYVALYPKSEDSIVDCWRALAKDLLSYLGASAKNIHDALGLTPVPATVPPPPTLAEARVVELPPPTPTAW